MKRLLLSITLGCTAFTAQAAEVSLTLEKQNPVIHLDPQGKEFAVFQRFNDLWLVFNSETEKMLPSALVGEPAIGLLAQEKLAVSNGGSGIRLSFSKKQPFYLEKDISGYNIKIGQGKTTESKAILNIMSLKEGIRLSGENLAHFLTVQSMQTGERYTVMPMDILNSQANDKSFYPIKFLKTLSGRAFTAVNGELIDLVPQNGEYMIFTSPKEKVNFNKFTGNRAVLNEIEEGVPVEFRDPKFLEMFATGIDGSTKKSQLSFGDTLSLLTEAIDRIDQLPTPKDGQPLYDKKKILDELAARRGAAAALQAQMPVALPEADILLPRYTKVGEQDFRHFETKFLKRLRQSHTEKDINDGRLQLAKLAFAFKRYAEAGALLAKIPQENLTDSHLAQVKILMGASNVLTYRAKEALPLLAEGEHLEADRLVWQAAALEATGDHAKAAELFANNIDASRAYPPHLQIALRLSQARALLKDGQYENLEKHIFDMERLVPDGDIPAEAKLLLAKGYLAQEKYEEGERLLSEAARSDNPEAAFMAQYEFVTHLLDHGELTQERALAHLEDLRFLWRGGELEQDILYRLGNIYLNEENYRKGLERLKYYTIYFSHSPHIEDVAEKMTDSFNNFFFSDKVLSEKDPLEILGLYYDFRELTPPGERGDQLIAKIGEKLRGLGLFKRATELLKHQLDYRTKAPAEKARLGTQLAELYLLGMRYNDGLEILDKTESKHIPNEIAQKRKLIRTRLLMAAGKAKDANDILMDMVDWKAKTLRAELHWSQKDYKRFIPLGEEILTKQSTPEKWEAEDHTNFARLVFAYSEVGDMAKIEGLEKKYPLYVAQPDVSRIFTFLKQNQEPINVDAYKGQNSNWAKIITHMDTFNEFKNQYNDYYEAREKEKKMRKVFNKRMGQPSAPSRMEQPDSTILN